MLQERMQAHVRALKDHTTEGHLADMAAGMYTRSSCYLIHTGAVHVCLPSVSHCSLASCPTMPGALACLKASVNKRGDHAAGKETNRKSISIPG
jgi:hypothetical protein